MRANSPSSYQFLEVETFDDGQIMRITLNRGDARNAACWSGSARPSTSRRGTTSMP